ncbi:hypothetical protein SSP24_80140 [Streptomyces spinoverrucosus]|uniref:Dioxygenase n=1 Tax=Streptomyces spinoverrucosus TaxID=284043 RepID=A0A4Y3VXB0_9ACTN|nr:hypothetical protein SSP24_80140 [Streptomyces spinoverrucosus]GHB98503.1 hypothetical protein GCM10010397_83700 [Streptomyces spinoverrucosus]
MTPDLDTLGPCDFGGRLTTGMTAHPKQDPVTGELHFFGCSFTPPYLTYHRLCAAGDLVESRGVPVAGPTMMHDFALTQNHVVWLDLPVVFDPALAGRGLPYRWEDSHRARLGVMRRDGTGSVRWYGISPCYLFHVGNAREDTGGRIVLEAVRYSPGVFATTWAQVSGTGDPASAAARTSGGHQHRWTLDPATGVVAEEPLDDRGVEFPTINDERTGRTSRYLYTVGDDTIIKYDTLTQALLIHPIRGESPARRSSYPPPTTRGKTTGGCCLSSPTARANART